MTDNELTKLCAEAMGLRWFPDSLNPERIYANLDGRTDEYFPLTDDAQAMALVKRFKLDIWWPFNADGGWRCAEGGKRPCESDDLNRAIVECIAKMQAAKTSDTSPAPAPQD